MAGFRTICDVARTRLSKCIAALNGSSIGFKAFVLAPSNFKQWRGDGIDTAEQLAEQMQLFTRAEKPGAQVEDMLYELLLKFGQELTTVIETLDVAAGRVFAVHQRQMLFVLEPLSAAMIVPLVALKPRELIAIDGVFQDSDTLKSNLDLQCRDAGIRFTCV